MKVLKLTGKGPDGELQSFHVINPTNVVVNTGIVQKEGTLKDVAGNTLMINELRTFVHVGTTPLIVEETIEEVLKQLE